MIEGASLHMKTSPANRSPLEEMGLRLEWAGRSTLDLVLDIALLLSGGGCLWLAFAGSEASLARVFGWLWIRLAVGVIGLATLLVFLRFRRLRHAM